MFKIALFPTRLKPRYPFASMKQFFFSLAAEIQNYDSLEKERINSIGGSYSSSLIFLDFLPSGDAMGFVSDASLGLSFSRHTPASCHFPRLAPSEVKDFRSISFRNLPLKCP